MGYRVLLGFGAVSLREKKSNLDIIFDFWRILGVFSSSVSWFECILIYCVVCTWRDSAFCWHKISQFVVVSLQTTHYGRILYGFDILKITQFRKSRIFAFPVTIATVKELNSRMILSFFDSFLFLISTSDWTAAKREGGHGPCGPTLNPPWAAARPSGESFLRINHSD